MLNRVLILALFLAAGTAGMAHAQTVPTTSVNDATASSGRPRRAQTRARSSRPRRRRPASPRARASVAPLARRRAMAGATAPACGRLEAIEVGKENMLAGLRPL